MHSKRKRQAQKKNASLISNLSFKTERIIRLFHMRSHQLLLYFLRVRDAGRNCNEIIHFPLWLRIVRGIRRMREIRAKGATRVEPDINSRVHFVGVNNFASFRFVPEEMPNWVGALRSRDFGFQLSADKIFVTPVNIRPPWFSSNRSIYIVRHPNRACNVSRRRGPLIIVIKILFLSEKEKWNYKL